MAKSTLKTKENKKSVTAFINSLSDAEKKKDSKTLVTLMQKITGEKPVMWGSSIIGFGKYHYKSERSAQEGDWPLTGFSPRKQNMTVYIMPGFGSYTSLLKKLGPHKTGVSCLYIKRLSDVDLPTLEKLVAEGLKAMKKRYPSAR